MGKQEYALLRMYSRYKTMIPCSFTILWEHYDRWWGSHIDSYDDASSLNHGWNPPALFLSQSIAGISPEAAGWSTYHVLPQEAFLTSIKCAVSSIKGKIALEMRKTASEYSIRLTSPANPKAIVGVPKGSFSKLTTIEADGTTIWDGAYKGGVTGITWNGERVPSIIGQFMRLMSITRRAGRREAGAAALIGLFSTALLASRMSSTYP